jgi:hypothetical protein
MMLVCACKWNDNQDDDSDEMERPDVCDGAWQRLRPDNILSDEMAAELSAKASCRVSPGRSQL